MNDKYGKKRLSRSGWNDQSMPFPQRAKARASLLKSTLIGGFTALFILISMPSLLAGDAVTALSEAGIHLIPYPQEVTLRGADVELNNPITIVLDKNASEADRFAASELANQLKSEWNITANISNAPAGTTVILSRKGADKKLGDEGYTLSTAESKINIQANGEAGLFYGVQTLLQIIQQNNGKPVVKGMEIIDWPDTPQRAAHYDTKHHQDKAEYVRSFIRDMARYKINILVWEWEDKLAYPSHPEIGAPGAFTMEEMQEFTRYAQQYHVQIVPLVQGLGHVSFILKWPQYAHLREIPASNWEFCPLKEGTYELLGDLWKDAIEATPGSEFIHIGSDETFELAQCPQCKAKAEDIGASGVYHLFVNESAKLLKKTGREVMVWERPMGWTMSDSPAKDIVPQKDVILTESYDYETPDFKYAKQAKDLGYTIYAYDPNPGIEQIFLPYYFRKNKKGKFMGSLENSYQFLTSNIGSGLFDGMINTSWDDAGLHNQVWMLSFATSAEYAWSASNPGLEEFKEKFFLNYYGDAVQDMEELFMLLNEGAYYYMETFERKVWHYGNIGKTHLPDLPRGDALEYDPFWNKEYAEMIEKSEEMNKKMARALAICHENEQRDVKNTYDFEVFASIARLLQHTAQTYLDLSNLEYAIREAHQQRFLSLEAAYASLQHAEEIVEGQLARRANVFDSLVTTWEKTRLPKGMTTPEKEYFFRQDRARHFANRTSDMTYLIYDEQLLDVEGYLEKLKAYSAYFKETFLEESAMQYEMPSPK